MKYLISDMNTFLIAPVRQVDPKAYAFVVRGLERQGWTVYWPARDTNQVDLSSLNICKQNAAAIFAADAVHVIWDGVSQGCLFDLGVAFALKKNIIPIDLPIQTDGRSFQNLVYEWAALGSAEELDNA